MLVDVVDSIFKDSQGQIQYHYSLVEWTGEFVSGELNADDDASDAEWFELGEIKNLGLWEKTVEIINKADIIRKRLVL
jgi:ADP-ribose pyrophosphatase YjhB (NUDIX family)